MTDPETRLNAACAQLTHAIDDLREENGHNETLAEADAHRAYECASAALKHLGETPDKTRSYNDE